MEVLFRGHWHSDRRHEPDLEKRATDIEEGLDGPAQTITIPQATLFILWIVACSTLVVHWLYSRQRQAPELTNVDPESIFNNAGEKNGLLDEEGERTEGNPLKPARRIASNSGGVHFHGAREIVNGDVSHVQADLKDDSGGKVDDDFQAESREVNFDKEEASREDLSSNPSGALSGSNVSHKAFSSVKSPPGIDQFLKYATCLGIILFYFFLCEVWDEWPAGERTYDRDQFMFLTLLMFLVAAAFTLRTCPDKILNRDQTEEWKGWMQVMFVWYHYFKAAETYNLVRVYIACYVWMTGFGNFSFFWVKKDFSLWRMMKMLFRLNFLVVLVVMVTDNSYMLYYICAMHTYWFLSVYVFMFVLQSWNEDRLKMAVKFTIYFMCNTVIFDTPLVHFVFRPFSPVLSYEGSLHEWQFRVGLDHHACFVGMLCAYNYPHYERFVNYLDKRHIDRRDRLLSLSIKAFTIGVLLILVVIWYKEFMFKEKYEYNRLHPYISWFPILTYIILRNMFPAMRTHYLHFFSFLGKITLETYISQLHIFLKSNAKELITYIPNYPLMNFALATAIYVFLSYWLFEITTIFSAFLFPQSVKKLGINLIVGFIICSLSACLAFLLKEASLY